MLRYEAHCEARYEARYNARCEARRVANCTASCAARCVAGCIAECAARCVAGWIVGGYVSKRADRADVSQSGTARSGGTQEGIRRIPCYI